MHNLAFALLVCVEGVKPLFALCRDRKICWMTPCIMQRKHWLRVRAVLLSEAFPDLDFEGSGAFSVLFAVWAHVRCSRIVRWLLFWLCGLPSQNTSRTHAWAFQQYRMRVGGRIVACMSGCSKRVLQLAEEISEESWGSIVLQRRMWEARFRSSHTPLFLKNQFIWQLYG